MSILTECPHFSSHKNVSEAILKGINEHPRMWEILVSRHLAFKFNNTPNAISFYPWLATVACMATKQHENCCSGRIDPKVHWSRAVFRV